MTGGSERLSERDKFREWLESMPPQARAGVEAVRGLVQSERCVMFSTTWCPYCTKAEDFIVQESAGLARCRKIDFDAPPGDMKQELEQAAPALAALTGQRTVPNIFIARKHIGGYSELMEVAKQCKAGQLPSEHRDICQFLAGAAE
eukprot:TRINITY_DN6978_c0_g1_i2.p1 TRINITY_DN6978_c0_g1~~TRINITY_DN6978_c0_g1_i2.p1  ORF type:complete len:146 (-),score=30.37 TRINITY_DN6978_c0_g1_i2:89-526(-)